MVPHVVFGRDNFNQLSKIIEAKRIHKNSPFIFIVVDVFKGNVWMIIRISLKNNDTI